MRILSHVLWNSRQHTDQGVRYTAVNVAHNSIQLFERREVHVEFGGQCEDM